MGVAPTVDPETGEEREIGDVTTGAGNPFHGRIGDAPDAWIEGDFVRAVLGSIESKEIREVGLDHFGPNPSQVHSKDPADTDTLCVRYGVNRDTINRWIRVGRAKLQAAMLENDQR
jgi:hypothetical protein